MDLKESLIRNTVREILKAPEGHKWTLQGMGLLRLYLTPDVRLHVWDSRYRNPGVSMIHDHLQWDLESYVVAGVLRNRRYTRFAADAEPRLVRPEPYHCRVLRAGMGFEFREDQKDCLLLARPQEIYKVGESYRQDADEIHETDADDGTVTIMTKTQRGNELATVFWPRGTEWGSAEPRIARLPEIRDICANALDKHFQD